MAQIEDISHLDQLTAKYRKRLPNQGEYPKRSTLLNYSDWFSEPESSTVGTPPLGAGSASGDCVPMVFSGSASICACFFAPRRLEKIPILGDLRSRLTRSLDRGSRLVLSSSSARR